MDIRLREGARVREVPVVPKEARGMLTEERDVLVQVHVFESEQHVPIVTAITY